MLGTAHYFPLAPHNVAEKMARAFAAGARANGLDWFAKPWSGVTDDANSTYGILHGGTEVIRQCEAEKKDYFYIDHGYFGRSSSMGAMDGYYRVVKNDLQHTVFCGVGGAPAVSERGERRLREFGATLAPRRNPADGEVIVLVPPTHHQWRFYSGLCDEPDEWTAKWKAHAEKTFTKEVVVSKKGGEKSLTTLLDKASYVIGFNSSGLIEAAARGIMVQSTGPSPLFWLKPYYGREQWEETRYALFCEMALRQYTLPEIRSGAAHLMMRNNGDLSFE
jgi:hypothetical protein